MGREQDAEAKQFAATLGESTKELVADLRSQIEKGDFRANPDSINTLKPSPAVLAKIRRRIEGGLNRGFSVGQKQGLRAVEAAVMHEEDRAELLQRFAELDPDDLSITRRAEFDRLFLRLKRSGYL